MAEHVAAAERRLLEHPELLAASKETRPGRRRNPGLLAMQDLQGDANAGEDAGRRRRKSSTDKHGGGNRSRHGHRRA